MIVHPPGISKQYAGFVVFFSIAVFIMSLMMHELGHNLGLRHTDCFMKGEGNGSYGMVKIPNTPEIDQVSYMNSNTCGLNWNGMPFYDAVALRNYGLLGVLFHSMVIKILHLSIKGIACNCLGIIYLM